MYPQYVFSSVFLKHKNVGKKYTKTLTKGEGRWWSNGVKVSDEGTGTQCREMNMFL